MRSATATHRADTAHDHADGAEDNEPDAAISGRATHGFGDLRACGVGGADAVGEKDYTDNEESEGEDLIHRSEGWFVVKRRIRRLDI